MYNIHIIHSTQSNVYMEAQNQEDTRPYKSNMHNNLAHPSGDFQVHEDLTSSRYKQREAIREDKQEQT
jgi:hypothetical protein